MTSTSSGTPHSTPATRRHSGKPLIVLHPPEHTHALKEVNGAALATAEDPDQVVAILRYVCEGRLDRLDR